MLDATLWGDAGAVAAKPSSRGPGNLPNNDPPIADVSVLPVGTAVSSLESAVVLTFLNFLTETILRRSQFSEIRNRPR
jgi:hypothetical protein